MPNQIPSINGPVLLHTSMKALGVRDGLAYLNDWRDHVETLLIPTHTGRPEYSPKVVVEFDVKTSEPMRIGLLPKLAYSLGERSLNATHSVVAFGENTASLIASHLQSQSPCDKLSPYFRLCERDGWIALAGCDHESNTSLHMIEELVECWYHLQPGVGTCHITDQQGEVHIVPSRLHSWLHPRNFSIVEEELIAQGIQSNHELGRGILRLVRAQPMMEVVLKKLRHNPNWLLKKSN